MFKHSKNFNYKVIGSRSENCVLIDSQNWLVNDSNNVIGVNSRGGIAKTYITEVLAENLTTYSGEITAGDTILITAVAARLYGSRPFSIPIDLDNTKYTDVPFTHAIGKFIDNKISLSSLHLLGDYVLLKRLRDIDTVEDFVLTTNTTESVYEVVKTSNNVSIDSNNILLRDNVSTPIMLNGTQYYAASYKDIIAEFNDDSTTFSLTDIKKVLNNYIFLEDYQTQFANEGDTIYKPNYDPDADDEFLSETYNESRFRVLKSGNNEFDVDDILYVIRDSLEYCTLHGIKYFVTSNKCFIIAKFREK